MCFYSNEKQANEITYCADRGPLATKVFEEAGGRLNAQDSVVSQEAAGGCQRPDVVVVLLVNRAVGQESVGSGKTAPLLTELLTSCHRHQAGHHILVISGDFLQDETRPSLLLGKEPPA